MRLQHMSSAVLPHISMMLKVHWTGLSKTLIELDYLTGRSCPMRWAQQEQNNESADRGSWSGMNAPLGPPTLMTPSHPCVREGRARFDLLPVVSYAEWILFPGSHSRTQISWLDPMTTSNSVNAWWSLQCAKNGWSSFWTRKFFMLDVPWRWHHLLRWPVYLHKRQRRGRQPRVRIWLDQFSRILSRSFYSAGRRSLDLAGVNWKHSMVTYKIASQVSFD